ncbi:MAG: comEA [Gammaproteobacteria bacterium]|jgi:competence protein ComEA|nr:comEA [Gammaproteobacteria bacterium]
MSFYRTLIATVAALGLATSVFAAEEATPAVSDSTTQVTTTETTTASETTEITQLNINSATVEELAKVKGLNAVKAAKIVKYRDANGNFTSLDDLKKVKGLALTPKQLKMVKKELTI